MINICKEMRDTYSGITDHWLFRWTNRSFYVYDCEIKKLQKYKKHKINDNTTVSLTGNMEQDIHIWLQELKESKKWASDEYKRACSEDDFLESDIYKEINKMLCNEIYFIEYFLETCKKPNRDIGSVEKIVHDFFEAHPYCKLIDFSI